MKIVFQTDDSHKQMNIPTQFRVGRSEESKNPTGTAMYVHMMRGDQLVEYRRQMAIK
jgi:predicted Zn-dependent peptidase